MPPEPVTYRLEPRALGVAERLLTRACPSCGADWTVKGNGLPRHGSGREYYCTSCGTFHRATEVDADGQPVPTPGWGVAHAERQREEGPDRRP